VIFAEDDTKHEETVGLETKKERQRFIDWYNNAYQSYYEDFKNEVMEEEGIDEEVWEDYKWDLDIAEYYTDIVDTNVINLPKGNIKFKVIRPGARIYRINSSRDLPQEYNLWFFPEDYIPILHTLESYGLFLENYYLLEIEVVEPLFLVDMDDLDNILRLMMDKRYYNQDINGTPFALAMTYAFLGESELSRTSSYKYDLPIASVLCQVQGFDGFISTTPPQHPEMVVCSKSMDKIRVVNSVKGTQIKQKWYSKIIRKDIENLKGKERMKSYKEELEKMLKNRDFTPYEYSMTYEKLPFQDLMGFK